MRHGTAHPKVHVDSFYCRRGRGIDTVRGAGLTGQTACGDQRPSYLQYDVFTDKPLAGNQLAVFTDTKGLTAEQMQAMTRETKFSECTFVQPSETGTDVRLRIFSPANEMQFAGRKEFTFGLGMGRPSSQNAQTAEN